MDEVIISMTIICNYDLSQRSSIKELFNKLGPATRRNTPVAHQWYLYFTDYTIYNMFPPPPPDYIHLYPESNLDIVLGTRGGRGDRLEHES